jgi:hypothetical protein
MKRLRVLRFLLLGLLCSLFINSGYPAGSAISSVHAAMPATPAGACAPVPSGLVSWWPGNGNARDIRGRNNGTVFSGTTYAPGKVGQAFNFDGQNGGVSIPDNPSLTFRHSFSIEAWINGGYSSGSQAQIFFRGDNRPFLDPYFLDVSTDHQIDFHVESLTARADISAPFPARPWVYVAATLDDATGLMSLYLNGVLAVAKSTTVRPFGSLLNSGVPGESIGNLQSRADNEPFRGLIDEMSVYNRALSAAQIHAIYHAGSAGKCKQPR